MSYLAIYRRFRPVTFDEVIGQDAIVKTLSNQIKTDRIGHAYLFSGARGTGKTTLAKIFAKAVNCLSNVNGSPCGECAACKALADPSNIDIIEMDAASNNKVENVRDIRESVQYPPATVKYKVYIIDEVHMLTTEAFNALLKTLEEPPKHAIFILATTEPHKLPATILSRCMRFDFRLVPTKIIAERISLIYDELGKKYTPDAVTAIAKAGEGSVRDALSVADLCVSVGEKELTYNDVLTVLGATDYHKTDSLISSVLRGDTGKTLEITEELSMLGKSVGLLAKDALLYVRDLLVAKTCDDAREILALPEDRFLTLEKTASLADEHRLLRVLELLSGTENSLRYSTQPRAVFESVLVKAAMPENDYDQDALCSRVAALEKGGVSASGKFGENRIKEIENKLEKFNDFHKENEIIRELKEKISALEKEIEKLKESGGNGGISDTFKENVTSEKKSFNDEFIPDEPCEDGGFYFSGNGVEEIAPDRSEKKENDGNFTAEKESGIKKEESEVTPLPSFEKKQVVDNPAVKTAGANGRKIWGTLVRRLRTMPGKTVLWVACQEMTAEVSGNTIIINAGGETERNLLSKPENMETISSIIGEFGAFNITFAGDKADDGNAAAKAAEFFGDVAEIKQ